MRFRAAIVALQALQCAMRSQLSHEVAFVRMRFRAAIVLDAELRCEDLGRMRVQPQLVFLDRGRRRAAEGSRGCWSGPAVGSAAQPRVRRPCVCS